MSFRVLATLTLTRRGSRAIVHISELHFRRVIEPGYLSGTLPKLDIVVINQLLCLPHRRVIVGAVQCYG
jgi:hypothetical protein